MARTSDTSQYFPRVEGALTDADIPQYDQFVAARDLQADQRRRQLDEAAATTSED